MYDLKREIVWKIYFYIWNNSITYIFVVMVNKSHFKEQSIDLKNILSDRQ